MDNSGATQTPVSRLESTQRPWLPHARASFVFWFISMLLASFIVIFFSKVNVFEMILETLFLTRYHLPWFFWLWPGSSIVAMLMSFYAINRAYHAERMDEEQPQHYRGVHLAKICFFLGSVSIVIALPGAIFLLVLLGLAFASLVFYLLK